MAILFFWGLARVPLAQGVALAFVAPLIALYLAALILKEQIERRAILASLLGFAGVLVILAGQAEARARARRRLRGSIAILCSAALYAWNIILMRQQAQVARPVEIAFFTSLIMTSGFLLAAPFLAVPPPAAELPAIAGAARARLRLADPALLGLCPGRGAISGAGRIYRLHLGGVVRPAASSPSRCGR